MRRWWILGAVLGLLGLVSLFQVREGRQALVVRLGHLVEVGGKVATLGPGLHVKRPFVDEVLVFDTRLQTLEETASRTLTKEQKYLMVDYFVKWRISDLSLFYQRTMGRTYLTEQILRQKINNALRAAFGSRTVQEVVSDDRKRIMGLLRKEANASTQDLGVDVIDVRVKRIDLPEKVSHSVFLNMRADRERVATKHRANGRAAAEAIRARADADAQVLIAQAKADAAALRAKGDAEAALMTSEAYHQDPGFYQLVSRLEAYKHVFRGPQDVLLLSPKMPLLSLMDHWQI